MKMYKSITFYAAILPLLLVVVQKGYAQRCGQSTKTDKVAIQIDWSHCAGTAETAITLGDEGATDEDGYYNFSLPDSILVTEFNLSPTRDSYEFVADKTKPIIIKRQGECKILQKFIAYRIITVTVDVLPSTPKIYFRWGDRREPTKYRIDKVSTSKKIKFVFELCRQYSLTHEPDFSSLKRGDTITLTKEECANAIMQQNLQVRQGLREQFKADVIKMIPTNAIILDIQ